MLALLEVWEFMYRDLPRLGQRHPTPISTVQVTGLNYEGARHAFNCRFLGSRTVVISEKRISSMGPA